MKSVPVIKRTALAKNSGQARFQFPGSRSSGCMSQLTLLQGKLCVLWHENISRAAQECGEGRAGEGMRLGKGNERIDKQEE